MSVESLRLLYALSEVWRLAPSDGPNDIELQLVMGPMSHQQN